MAHLGRRLRGSASVIDRCQLPSASPTSSYHLNHSDSTLAIRAKTRRCVKILNFDTPPVTFRAPPIHQCSRDVPCGRLPHRMAFFLTAWTNMYMRMRQTPARGVSTPPCNIIVMRNFTLMRYCECPEGMGLCSRVHGAFRATCARSCRGRGGVPGRHLVGIESVEKIVPQPIGAVLRNKVSCQTPPTPHYKTGHTCLLGIVYPATQPHALRASSPPNPAPPRHG